VSPVDVRDAAEIERAINAFALGPNGGLIVLSNPTAVVNRKLRADKAQEGGINHAAIAAPASTPSAKTNAPIISLAVWLSSGGDVIVGCRRSFDHGAPR
jgi:hypothetical protein